MTDNAKPEFETPHVLHDAPLRFDDVHHFHFDQFAATLARLIASKDTRTPLTIGINGSWGSGKTTLLLRTKKMLDDAGDLSDVKKIAFVSENDDPQQMFRTCKTVRFDAWKYSHGDHLLAALIGEIQAAMAHDGLGNKLWSIVLDKSYPRYDVIAALINLLLLLLIVPRFIVSCIAHVAGIEPLTFNINKLKTETPFAQNKAFFDFFDNALEKLLARWVYKTGDPRKVDESKGALVIFIDDLDRCPPDKVVQVLETINLFLDKPGCVVVLGADVTVIHKAVTSYYKSINLEGDSVDDYLEKIIQLCFELPPILTDQMGDFLWNDDEAKKALDGDVLRHWLILITGAKINPRKVKAFANEVNLRWAMLKNSGQAWGVNRDDFIRWQVIVRVAPLPFLERIREIDDLYTRFQFVNNALHWAKGEKTDKALNSDLEKTLKKQAPSLQFQSVLKKITFSEEFDAQTLDGFIHLVTFSSEAPGSTADNWELNLRWMISGAGFDSQTKKTIVDDVSLQWAKLVSSDEVKKVDCDDYLHWLVLRRAAPHNFVKRVYDIDDEKIRYDFIAEALKWAQGEASLDATFRDYAQQPRLRRTLKAIKAFSTHFTAKTLDDFIHLTAKPMPLPEEGSEPAEPDMGPDRRDTAKPTWGGLEWVHVPARKFLMGSKDDNKLASENERPQDAVDLPEYWIGKYPATNAQFAKFVDAAQYRFDQGDWQKKADHPVVKVTWRDAMAYCQWLNATLRGELKDLTLRLPTEAEWEKAARGKYGNEWPWGNEFDQNKCNSREGGKGGTTPVGAYSPHGDSPYGATDMAGNVWEWCHSLYKPYPYKANDGRENEKDYSDRVLRGGAWTGSQWDVRCALRNGLDSYNFNHDIGFRVVVSPRLG